MTGIAQSMRAAVLERLGGPIVVRRVPVPRPGPGEVLVRVAACGVCRTDLKIRAGHKKDAVLPAILGHEIAGTVAGLGPGVEGLALGDPVVVGHNVVCGTCAYCRSGRDSLCGALKAKIGYNVPGGYAEYVRAPRANCFPVPPGVDLAGAAILGDAVATPLHAVAKADLRLGHMAVVVGAGGGVGVHAVQLARLAGARVLAVDVGGVKLEAAREAGAETGIDAAAGPFDARVREATGGEGADAVFEFVSRPDTLEQSLKALRRGGTLVMVGYEPDSVLAVGTEFVVTRELRILGSRSADAADLREAIRLVDQGRVRPVVTRRYPLEAVEEAHAALRNGSVVGRTVLAVAPAA